MVDGCHIREKIVSKPFLRGKNKGGNQKRDCQAHGADQMKNIEKGRVFFSSREINENTRRHKQLQNIAVDRVIPDHSCSENADIVRERYDLKHNEYSMQYDKLLI